MYGTTNTKSVFKRFKVSESLSLYFLTLAQSGYIWSVDGVFDSIDSWVKSVRWNLNSEHKVTEIGIQDIFVNCFYQLG